MPLHKQFTRQVRKPKPSKPQPNLEQQALAIVSAGASENETLAALLKLAIGAAGGIGGFIAARAQEQWFLANQKPTFGKVPSPSFFGEEFSQQCETFVSSNEVKTWACETLEGVLMFSVPLRRDEEAPELMMILATTDASIVEATQGLNRIANTIRLWMRGNNAQDANWQVQSLASIIAMVSQIETHTTIKSAAEETVNLMSNHLPVTGAAIGIVDRDAIRRIRRLDRIHWRIESTSTGSVRTLHRDGRACDRSGAQVRKTTPERQAPSGERLVA